MVRHALPAEVAGGTLGSASVVWDYTREGRRLQFRWNLGHEVTVVLKGRTIDSFRVGDLTKVTTSRRSIENEITKYLEDMQVMPGGDSPA